MTAFIFVGESNPYSYDPSDALACYPPRSAGAHLREILGVSEDVYMEFDRTNLCVGSDWSMREARRRAAIVYSGPWTSIILLGRKVATAFNYNKPFFTGSIILEFSGCLPQPTLISLPHPSHLCRIWHNHDAVVGARNLLRVHHPEIQWGGA